LGDAFQDFHVQGTPPFLDFLGLLAKDFVAFGKLAFSLARIRVMFLAQLLPELSRKGCGNLDFELAVGTNNGVIHE
jgi:hypothetical protein